MAAPLNPVEFIQGLELASSSFSSPSSSLPPDNQQQGYVDAGALLAFPDTLAGQAKADILNSTLLAQLASDKKFDRQKDPSEWYKFYNSVLSNVGWVGLAFSSFNQYKPAGETFTMDAAVKEVLSQGKLPTDILTKVLTKLKATGDSDSAVTTFNQQSYDATKGANFQVSVTAKDGDSVVLANGGFYFAYTKPVARFLFHEWSSKDVTLYYSVEMFELNDSVYSRVRQIVVDKLGDKINQLELPLSIN